MNPIVTISRADALDRALAAFFAEVHEDLSCRLRAPTMTWTIAFMGGRCTEVLLKSERTQERFESLRDIRVRERSQQRRLERLAEELEEFLGELSEACDHAEDKAHGTLCTFEGVDGRLDQVLLEVFCREHYASEVIKLRLEVARTQSLRDAVAIPMFFEWKGAVSSTDEKFARARACCDQQPEDPWAWLLCHTLVGMRGTRETTEGGRVLQGLTALTVTMAKGETMMAPVSARAVREAIGELAAFHDTRTLALDGAAERRYWEQPPRKVAHAMTWKIVAAVMARHTERDLSVFELHPGGGMGDTLSLRDMATGGMFGVELNDFRSYRRLGRQVAKGAPDPFGDGGYYIRRARFGEDFEHLVDDICACCDLPPGATPEAPLSDPKVLGYATMAALIANHSDHAPALEWRSAICDTSGYPGTAARPAFDADKGGFVSILKALPAAREGQIHPLYGLWMLVKRPVGAIEREDVRLIIQPATATAWGRSRGKKPKAIDLQAALASEGSMDKLITLLRAKRLDKA